MKVLKTGFFLIACAALLSGCQNAVVLHPQGSIGMGEKSLILLAAALMLLVVLPALIMALLFAWRYRASNNKASYKPEQAASYRIELIIWLIPSLIIIALSTLTWISSHKLDPYQPLKDSAKPLTVQVVSLDWKWLFIYPEQQLASVNELVLPINRPIHFYLTSASVINSFFIPQLGSQIMTMAGMQTQLYLNINKTGIYDGISANYSGEGFSGMNFKVLAYAPQDFQNWVNKTKQSHKQLNQTTYLTLLKPSSNDPVTLYSSVTPNLFTYIMHHSESKPAA